MSRTWAVFAGQSGTDVGTGRVMAGALSRRRAEASCGAYVDHDQRTLRTLADGATAVYSGESQAGTTEDGPWYLWTGMLRVRFPSACHQVVSRDFLDVVADVTVWQKCRHSEILEQA